MMFREILQVLTGRRLVRALLGHSHWHHPGAAPTFVRFAPPSCVIRPRPSMPAQVSVAITSASTCRALAPRGASSTRWGQSRSRTLRDRRGESGRCDQVSLVSDTICTVDADSGRTGGRRVPHPACDFDGAQAREGVHLLADRGLRELRAGHAEPVARDFARHLRRDGANEGDRYAS